MILNELNDVVRAWLKVNKPNFEPEDVDFYLRACELMEVDDPSDTSLLHRFFEDLIIYGTREDIEDYIAQFLGDESFENYDYTTPGEFFDASMTGLPMTPWHIFRSATDENIYFINNY